MTRQAEVAPQEAVASQEAIAPQEAVAPQMEIVSQTATAPSEPEDKEIATSMPYLFSAAREADKADIQLYNQPVGDAVVPGGAAHTPDLETLKKYLMLREHDVAALSSQFKSAKERIVNIEQLLKVEQARNSELMHTLQTQQDKLDGYDKEKKVEFEVLNDEVKELKFQLKAKNDKVRMFEIKIRDAADETERLKDRVRSDIRKIRVREKELENKLEIIKKDSEALIGSRENKIIELKRKLDLLEFNLDLLQDRYSREKDTSAQLRERLAKAAQVVRLAGGLLDSESSDRLAEMLEDGESAKKAS
jgi:chromosome segregation ATPase